MEQLTARLVDTALLALSARRSFVPPATGALLAPLHRLGLASALLVRTALLERAIRSRARVATGAQLAAAFPLLALPDSPILRALAVQTALPMVALPLQVATQASLQKHRCPVPSAISLLEPAWPRAMLAREEAMPILKAPCSASLARSAGLRVEEPLLRRPSMLALCQM